MATQIYSVDAPIVHKQIRYAEGETVLLTPFQASVHGKNVSLKVVTPEPVTAAPIPDPVPVPEEKPIAATIDPEPVALPDPVPAPEEEPVTAAPIPDPVPVPEEEPVAATPEITAEEPITADEP